MILLSQSRCQLQKKLQGFSQTKLLAKAVLLKLLTRKSSLYLYLYCYHICICICICIYISVFVSVFVLALLKWLTRRASLDSGNLSKFLLKNCSFHVFSKLCVLIVMFYVIAPPSFVQIDSYERCKLLCLF